MKIESIQIVGNLQIETVYTFDSGKETDVLMVKQCLSAEKISYEQGGEEGIGETGENFPNESAGNPV